MTDEHKASIREIMAHAAERAIAAMELQRPYAEEGEAYTIVVEFSFSHDPNKVWRKPEDEERADHYLCARVEHSHTEAM